MTRHHSLLLLGRNYRKPAQFPRCDVTWTTLACINDDPDILNIPNLLVWDTGHDIPNSHNVEIYDINGAPGAWQRHIDFHGYKFANQYCWMLADVGTEGSPFANVTLFGMNMDNAEYRREAQYIAYFIGYAKANGVSFTICDPSAILRPSLYGWMRERKNTGFTDDYGKPIHVGDRLRFFVDADLGYEGTGVVAFLDYDRRNFVIYEDDTGAEWYLPCDGMEVEDGARHHG